MVIENTESVKKELKYRYVTLKNASVKLKVNYDYLVKSVNGYEAYNSVINALVKNEISVRTKSGRRVA